MRMRMVKKKISVIKDIDWIMPAAYTYIEMDLNRVVGEAVVTHVDMNRLEHSRVQHTNQT